MESPRLLIALALVAVFLVRANGHGPDFSVMDYGVQNPNDTLVFDGPVSKTSSWIGLNVHLEWERKLGPGFRITHVSAVNDVTDGTGASVMLAGGGPGFDHIKLCFHSRMNQGIYYHIKLYAKKVPKA